MRAVLRHVPAILVALLPFSTPADDDVQALADTNAGIRVGFTFDARDTERWRQDCKIFAASADQLGATCHCLATEGSARKQAEQVRTLLDKGIDVLVVVPRSATATANAVKQARQRGVPVLAYGRVTRNCDADLYLGFDNVRIGRLQVEYLASQQQGRYILLNGSRDDRDAAERVRQGQEQALRPYLDDQRITVIGDHWTEGDAPTKARAFVANLLAKEGTNVDVIVAADDALAGGAIEALAALGLDGKVLVSGQNAELTACRRVLAGTQGMTVYKPVKALATRAAEAAVALARGETIETEATVNTGNAEIDAILLEPILLDKRSLVDVLTADGCYTREELLD
jgi:D-xylose transport system substrate-binding protein